MIWIRTERINQRVQLINICWFCSCMVMDGFCLQWIYICAWDLHTMILPKLMCIFWQTRQTTVLVLYSLAIKANFMVNSICTFQWSVRNFTFWISFLQVFRIVMKNCTCFPIDKYFSHLWGLYQQRRKCKWEMRW